MTIAILALTIVNLVFLKEMKNEIKNLKAALDEIKNGTNKPKAV
ncbi:MAG TPA: hypothetical protein VLK22_00180 [Candidatus Udaeobacter sp.]|nr:hypothetical protein [Candidatus Udaeobacter sp.]